MKKNFELAVVRSSNIEVGKRYLVSVHGEKQKWMKAISVPSVPLSKMTPEDKFVFATPNNKTVLELHTHGTGGPQFLVAKVKGKRGADVNARVTFYTRRAIENSAEGKTKKAA